MTSLAGGESIGEIVRQILAYATNSDGEGMAPSRRLRDLGIDSVGSAAVGVVIQSETGVDIEIEELTELFACGTVGQLIERVAQLRPDSNDNVAV